MIGNTIPRWVWATAAAVVCGALGWTAGQLTAPSSPAPRADGSRQSAIPAPHGRPDAGPSILVAQDGNVTLHVERQPLKWVLAEINRQASSAHIDQAAMPTNAAAVINQPAATPAAVANRRADVGDRILRGTEAERYDGLVQAQNGGEVSDAMLRTLYETDASPRVRQLAFDYSLEGTEADPAARRNALEAARLLPDPVIAQEAARLLEAMPRDEPGRRDAQQVAAQQP